MGNGGIIGEFLSNYESQAAAKRTKPSHKTTSPNHTVYRFTSPRISRSSCSKGVRKVTHGLNGFFRKECSSRRVPSGETKGRWQRKRALGRATRSLLAGENCHAQNGHSPLTAWQTSLEAALCVLARPPSMDTLTKRTPWPR